MSVTIESAHGTSWRYNHHGCRCDVCRSANTERCRRRRMARLSMRIPSGVPHGTASTYANYGCRCRPCRDANATACRDYAARSSR